MKHENSRTLHRYWNRLRGHRRAPMRLEIDPGAIAAILGNAFVLERLDPVAYRYRLAGTRVCSYLGKELRGTSFPAQWADDERDTVENLLYTITEDAAGALIGLTAHGGTGRTAPLELMLLPLARDNGALDRIIGTVSTLRPSDWVGALPVTRLEIKSIRLLWPDGKPLVGRSGGTGVGIANPPINTDLPPARTPLRVIEGGLQS